MAKPACARRHAPRILVDAAGRRRRSLPSPANFFWARVPARFPGPGHSPSWGRSARARAQANACAARRRRSALSIAVTSLGDSPRAAPRRRSGRWRGSRRAGRRSRGRGSCGSGSPRSGCRRRGRRGRSQSGPGLPARAPGARRRARWRGPGRGSRRGAARDRAPGRGPPRRPGRRGVEQQDPGRARSGGGEATRAVQPPGRPTRGELELGLAVGVGGEVVDRRQEHLLDRALERAHREAFLDRAVGGGLVEALESGQQAAVARRGRLALAREFDRGGDVPVSARASRSVCSSTSS